jgi:TPR repeat protein
MFLLANAYRAGTGVARDDAQAVAWYEKAAEQAHAGALQTLAMAHLYGELGLAQDELESRRYAMEAAHALNDGPALP